MKLYVRETDGTYRPAKAPELRAAAIKTLERRRSPVKLTNPSKVAEYLKFHLGHEPDEVFAVLYMDTRHRPIELRNHFRGTVDGAAVHPRVVVRTALELNAAAVILAHNHPSGDPEPSAADQAITDRLREALALIDVRALDHIIIAHSQHLSFAERGLL